MRQLARTFGLAGYSGTEACELPVDLQLVEADLERQRLILIRRYLVSIAVRLVVAGALLLAGGFSGYALTRGKVPSLQDLGVLFGASQ